MWSIWVKLNSLQTQAVRSEAAFKTDYIMESPFRSVSALTYPRIHCVVVMKANLTTTLWITLVNICTWFELNNSNSVTASLSVRPSQRSPPLKMGSWWVLALTWDKMPECIGGSWRWSASTSHMHHVKGENSDLPTSCEVRTLQMSLCLNSNWDHSVSSKSNLTGCHQG